MQSDTGIAAVFRDTGKKAISVHIVIKSPGPLPMDMQKTILFILLFGVVNFFIILAHISLYQSDTPKLSWISMIVHALLLVIFPYGKIFKQKTTR